MILLLLLAAVQSAFAQPAGPNGSSFYFTGEVGAKGIEPSPSGKFGALRVSFGVATPGASCSITANLSNSTGNFEYQFSQESQLPAGKAILTLDFFGPNIANQAKGSELFVSNSRMTCSADRNRTYQYATDAVARPIIGIHPSDFDNPPLDFSLVPPKDPIRIAGGNSLVPDVRLRTTGVMKDPIELAVQPTDSRIHVSFPDKTVSCRSPLSVGGKVSAQLFLSIQIQIFLRAHMRSEFSDGLESSAASPIYPL